MFSEQVVVYRCLLVTPTTPYASSFLCKVTTYSEQELAEVQDCYV
jgi:hypothetical protein